MQIMLVRVKGHFQNSGSINILFFYILNIVHTVMSTHVCGAKTSMCINKMMISRQGNEFGHSFRGNHIFSVQRSCQIE